MEWKAGLKMNNDTLDWDEAISRLKQLWEEHNM
nr:MAG TPA: hypothetical protein [Caudoviricetes sp.]DAT49741.1 MAG TPA: hypothetical protein [Caudoviricetes sp.]